MNIFYDHQAFSLQNYGGISRYLCELIKGINSTRYHKAHLSLLWSNNVHLKEYDISVLPYPFPLKRRLLFKSNDMYNFIDTKLTNYDIYHATYFSSFLKRHIGKKPFVTTYYDMIYERLSHQFVDLSSDKLVVDQKKKVAQQASHLIAISESTKRDMIELLNVPPEKITVIYLGSPFIQRTNHSISNISHNPPYLLYVGNRTGYKNFLPFLESIAHLLIRYKIDLVCAGGGDFNADEQRAIQALSLREFVKHIPINDTILQKLYCDAFAFIFPSLYEGFGIPVLEAFSCNCPCIVSNTSSLPEVAGEAAIYMDPTRRESMADAVEKIILNITLRNILIQLGRQQLLRFSWQRTVNETLDVYQKLL